MAIIGKFEVLVKVEGQPLKEYENFPAVEPNVPDCEELSVEPTNQVTRFIEAASGTRFSIQYGVLPNYEFGQGDGLMFRTIVDGHLLTTPVVTKDTYEASNGEITTRAGAQYRSGTKWFRKDFMFNELTIDKECSSSMIGDPDIGTIMIKVWLKKGASENGEARTELTIEDVALSEKAVKGRAIDLSTRLGIAVETEEHKVWNGTKLGAEAAAVFKFLYRSREALMQLGLIKRPKSPTPLEDRDPSGLTPAEALQLIQQFKAREEATKAKVKKEKTVRNLEQLKNLKRTHSSVIEEDDSDLEEIPRPKIFKVVRKASIHEEIL